MIWAGKKTVTVSLWVFSNAKLFKSPPRLKKFLQGNSFKGKWTTQNSFTNSLKMTRFSRSLPARVSNKSWGSLTQGSWDAKHTQWSWATKKTETKQLPTSRKKPAEMPWQNSDQNHVERTLQSVEGLQVVQCGPGSQLLWAVTCAGLGIGDAAVCISFLLLYNSSPIFLNNHNKTQWFTKLNFEVFVLWSILGSPSGIS